MVPALLRDRVFRRYWSASTISMFGDQISGLALPLAAVLALHAGAAQMGYLTALEWLPSLLFGLPAGAWVDQHGRRRRMMIAADLGRAALFASIPACYALHVLSLAQLFVVTFGAGTLSILFNVSDGTLFVSIVAAERYLDGQSLIYGSRALSFVSGPSVGGVLVQALSAPLAVVADAVSFLGSAFFLGRIRPAEPPTDDEPGSVLAGARFIARSALVRASLIAVGTINFFNQHRGDLRRGDPGPAAVPGDRRVPGRQLRHPAAGRAARRAAGQHDRAAARAVGRGPRRRDRVRAAAAHAAAAIPAARGGRVTA